MFFRFYLFIFAFIYFISSFVWDCNLSPHVYLSFFALSFLDLEAYSFVYFLFSLLLYHALDGIPNPVHCILTDRTRSVAIFLFSNTNKTKFYISEFLKKDWKRFYLISYLSRMHPLHNPLTDKMNLVWDKTSPLISATCQTQQT